MLGFGESLKSLLVKKNMTISELAKEVNIPLKSIQEWVQNNRFPRNPELLKRISDYFGCSVHRLIFGTEDPHSSTIENTFDKVVLHSGLYEITVRRVREHKE